MHIDRRLETIANLVPQGCCWQTSAQTMLIYPCGCWKSKELRGRLPAILLQVLARRHVLQ